MIARLQKEAGIMRRSARSFGPFLLVAALSLAGIPLLFVLRGADALAAPRAAVMTRDVFVSGPRPGGRAPQQPELDAILARAAAYAARFFNDGAPADWLM